MTKFFHFYEDKTEFDNFHHKAQFLGTAFMPVVLLVLSFFGYLFAPLAILLIAAVSAMYLTGIVRSIVLSVQKKADVLSPLMISGLSGPAYLALLYFVDPSFTGIPGLILIVGVPAVLLIPLLVNHLADDDSDDYDEYDDDYDEDDSEFD